MQKGFISIFTAIFLCGTLSPSTVHAQALVLPVPGTMVKASPVLQPPALRGIKVYPDNPLKFDFVLDPGVASAPSKEESEKLVKYFLAALTTPEKDMWVNLSPYEKDRIVPDGFGQTEMGRDLLAQDYMLKQVTASLIYPEDETGKKFWARIYAEAAQKFGTTNIPVNTFNKVWIVPSKAVVYENAKAGTAYVVESTLNVMLEQDYLSLKENVIAAHAKEAGKWNQMVAPEVSALGSQVVREIVIPALNKEVNEGANFAHLRQVYSSLVLAAWYKKKIKDGILAQVYADQNKIKGLSSPHALTGDTGKSDVERIYNRYLTAFKKGAYNYIKEETDPVTKQIVPRKYFSGGINVTNFSNQAMTVTTDASMLSKTTAAVLLTVSLAAFGQQVVAVADSPAGEMEASQVQQDADDARKAEAARVLRATQEEQVKPSLDAYMTDVLDGKVDMSLGQDAFKALPYFNDENEDVALSLFDRTTREVREKTGDWNPRSSTNVDLVALAFKNGSQQKIDYVVAKTLPRFFRSFYTPRMARASESERKTIKDKLSLVLKTASPELEQIVMSLVNEPNSEELLKKANIYLQPKGVNIQREPFGILKLFQINTYSTVEVDGQAVSIASLTSNEAGAMSRNFLPNGMPFVNEDDINRQINELRTWVQDNKLFELERLKAELTGRDNLGKQAMVARARINALITQDVGNKSWDEIKNLLSKDAREQVARGAFDAKNNPTLKPEVRQARAFAQRFVTGNLKNILLAQLVYSAYQQGSYLEGKNVLESEGAWTLLSEFARRANVRINGDIIEALASTLNAVEGKPLAEWAKDYIKKTDQAMNAAQAKSEIPREIWKKRLNQDKEKPDTLLTAMEKALFMENIEQQLNNLGLGNYEVDRDGIITFLDLPFAGNDLENLIRKYQKILKSIPFNGKALRIGFSLYDQNLDDQASQEDGYIHLNPAVFYQSNVYDTIEKVLDHETVHALIRHNFIQSKPGAMAPIVSSPRSDRRLDYLPTLYQNDGFAWSDELDAYVANMKLNIKVFQKYVDAMKAANNETDLRSSRIALMDHVRNHLSTDISAGQNDVYLLRTFSTFFPRSLTAFDIIDKFLIHQPQRVVFEIRDLYDSDGEQKPMVTFKSSDPKATNLEFVSFFNKTNFGRPYTEVTIATSDDNIEFMVGNEDLPAGLRDRIQAIVDDHKNGVNSFSNEDLRALIDVMNKSVRSQVDLVRMKSQYVQESLGDEDSRYKVGDENKSYRATLANLYRQILEISTLSDRDENVAKIDAIVASLTEGLYSNLFSKFPSSDITVGDNAQTVPIVKISSDNVSSVGAQDWLGKHLDQMDIIQAFAILDAEAPTFKKLEQQEANILVIGGTMSEIKFLSERYPQSKITVVSLSEPDLQVIQGYAARSTKNQIVGLYQGDVRSITSKDLPDNSFDFIFAHGIDTSTFLEDVDSTTILRGIAAQEMRMLKKGGLLYHPYLGDKNDLQRYYPDAYQSKSLSAIDTAKSYPEFFVKTADNAQLAKKEDKVGGIDFNADRMDLSVKNAGDAIKFKMDPAMLKQLQNAQGFTPTIIKMQPLADVRAFLGVN